MKRSRKGEPKDRYWGKGLKCSEDGLKSDNGLVEHDN